jgi:hypothetical protein
MTICLAKANSGSNVLLGTFFHNRMTPEEQKTIGHFATTLPVRVDVDQDTSFLKLIKKISGELKLSIRYNYFSTRMINLIKEAAIKLGFIKNDPGNSGNQGDHSGNQGSNAHVYNGLHTIVSFDKYHNTEKMSYVSAPSEFCQLLLLIRLVGKKLILDLKYWIIAFDKNEIEQLYQNILNITQEVLDNPAEKISELVFELPIK